jgi:hypothetical protein
MLNDIDSKKSKLVLFTIIAAFTLLFIQCEESSNSTSGNSETLQPNDLLPASDEIAGWDKGTGPGDYGEADDQSSLYNLIDGAAELYIQNGFVSGVLQNYYGTIGGVNAKVELYIGDHGDSANAAAIFEEEQLVPQNITPWEAGDEAGIDQTALFHIIIHLRSERFYVRVTAEKGNDENVALITAQSFAMAVVEGIGN